MRNFCFWDLLSGTDKDNKPIWRIEIPVIQRGYAQGRKTAGNIRKDFLEAIHSKLESRETMHLDFVYGTINNNRIFEPLDGQQRLTTLFLLHWYFACLDGKDESKTLENFSYQTRNSSERFCKELANFKHNIQKSDRLSRIISQQPWFATAWKNDSTVAAMLVMIDAIHELFYDLKDKDCFNQLTKSKVITFNFIDLEKYGLTDDLYIKMNARGKPLTPFEIFKSALDKKLISLKDNGLLSQAETDSFSKMLDGEWLDLFFDMSSVQSLSSKEQKSESFDNRFLAFFVRIMEYSVLESTSEKATDTYDNLQKKRVEIMPQGEYKGLSGKFPLAFYEDQGGLSVDSINEIKRFLSRLTDKKSFAYQNGKLEKGYLFLNQYSNTLSKEDYSNTLYKEDEVFDVILSNTEHKYIESLKFYGYYKYLARVEQVNPKAFERWMRVVSNIAETVFFNRPEDYLNEIARIKKLVAHADDIESYLAQEGEFSGSHKAEWDEEQLKAIILTTNGKWRELIYRAERDNGYLRGGIGFLFRFVGINKQVILNSHNILNSHDVLTQFEGYLSKVETVFGMGGILSNRKNGDLFRRALLCYGNYSLERGKNQNLLTLGAHRDTSFTKLFKNEVKSGYLKQLFDEPGTLDTALFEKIIARELPNIKNQKDEWREGFIKHDEFLSPGYCNQYNYRKHDYDADGMIVLKDIQGKWWGYHALWLYFELVGTNASYKLLPNVTAKCPAVYGHLNISKCLVLIENAEAGKSLEISTNNTIWTVNDENGRSTICNSRQDVFKLLLDERWIEKI